MNGIRFDLEFQDASKRQCSGNVVAALVLNGTYWSSGTLCYEALAALFEQHNAPVAGTGVALDYFAPEVQAHQRGQSPRHPPGTVCEADMNRPIKTVPPPSARIYFRNGRVAEFTHQTLAYQTWLSLPRGTRAAFRGQGDSRPVYAWDYADKP